MVFYQTSDAWKVSRPTSSAKFLKHWKGTSHSGQSTASCIHRKALIIIRGFSRTRQLKNLVSYLRLIWQILSRTRFHNAFLCKNLIASQHFPNVQREIIMIESLYSKTSKCFTTRHFLRTLQTHACDRGETIPLNETHTVFHTVLMLGIAARKLMNTFIFCKVFEKKL